MAWTTIEATAVLYRTLITVMTGSRNTAYSLNETLPEGCDTPESLTPLFELLNSITQLAFIGGIMLAVLGFSTAGVLLMMPGEEYSRLGKKVAKNTLFGTILLLSANMVVGFLVSQLGGAVCA